MKASKNDSEQRINIFYCKNGDDRYSSVCSFATRVYKERIDAVLSDFPLYFVYAEKETEIVGCLGFTCASEKNPLLVETYFDFDLSEYISRNKQLDRKFFGEIGTLAVSKGNSDLVIFLIAGGMILCYNLQIKFIALTTTQAIQNLSVPLQIKLKHIGRPNIKLKSESFLNNWKKYFLTNPESVGIDINQAIPGVIKVKENAVNYGIKFSF